MSDVAVSAAVLCLDNYYPLFGIAVLSCGDVHTVIVYVQLVRAAQIYIAENSRA